MRILVIFLVTNLSFSTSEFIIVISTYTKDLDEQLKAGVEQDEIYQNLQAKTKENPTESLSKGYSLNEKKIFIL